MGKEGIGDVYVDQKTVKQNISMRFINNSLTLQRIKICVVSHSVLVGRQGNQTYPIAASGSLIMTNIDLADLWFKGVSGDAVVNILGTTKD